MPDETKPDIPISSAATTADSIGAGMPQDNHAPHHQNNYDEILAKAERVCRNVLAPNAQRADCATGPLPENFEALAAAGMLGIALPTKFGGLDAPASVQRKYTEMLAASCGVTAFVQAQHHGSSRMIANSQNDKLRETLAPLLASGRRMSAISFAHLRRPGPAVLRAEITTDGYRLNGTAPWVTGWGLMDQVVFGATLPDGSFVYCWSPARRGDYRELFDLADCDDPSLGSITASAPLPLCAMNASSTVELKLDNWFVPKEHFLSSSNREVMERADRNGVLNATSMPMGCATAAIDVIKSAAEKRGIRAAEQAAAGFTAELKDVRGQSGYWSERVGDVEFFTEAVKVRAWCIELAVRASHAAVTSASGSANSLSHPAQRLLREAMFYTIRAQTREVMEATLARLVHNSAS